MLPEDGPLSIRVPGISGVSIPAASLGAEIVYRWPQTMKLAGFYFMVRSAVAIELANTKLRMADDASIELASNGFGNVTMMPGLTLRGIAPLGRTFGGRMQSMQRIVRAGDQWIFQVQNDNAAIAVVPELFFMLERMVTVYPEDARA